MRCMMLAMLLILWSTPLLADGNGTRPAPLKSGVIDVLSPRAEAPIVPPGPSVPGHGAEPGDASRSGSQTVAGGDVKSASLAINRFTWAIFGQIASGDSGNLFLSPFSIATAMTMTMAGAAGKTREALALGLRLPGVEDADIAAVAALADDLNRAGEKGDFALAVANALYGEKNCEFKPGFIDFLANSFHSPLNPVDFVHQFDAVRQEINQWVEEKTAGKIKDLIPDGALGSLTRMVLVNAIYFKGKWLNPFSADYTRDADFHLADGSRKTVPLMTDTVTVPYTADRDSQVVLLPYVGDRLGMVVILPRPGKSLDEIGSGLTAERFETMIQAVRPVELELYLPRFTLTKGISLRPVLERLGMGPAFAADADFSGMSEVGGLQISEVLHKAFVQVNEEGTEAAAATAVSMITEAVREPPPVFRADRPFLFAILDRTSGAILFLGRLMNP